MRNMSFAMTERQIQDRTKDVTRRLGWTFVKEGELLRPVRKCMGLRPGEKIEALGPPILVVSVRREPLRMMLDDLDYGYEEVRREGFADHPYYRWPSEWIHMFCASHKGCTPASVITRIQFTYTDGEPA